MEQVTIFLTTPEAELFKSYQQFHETFALLVRQGVFDVKSGSVTINFDAQGQIGSIERKDTLFNRRLT